MSAKTIYACQRCTNCCRWPGFVKITDDDIARIAAHLHVSEHDFIQSHTRLRPYRDGLALKDKPNGECIFLEGRDCTVQPVKPAQCRGFPNEWNFPGWREVCQAVPIAAGSAVHLERSEAQRNAVERSHQLRATPLAKSGDLPRPRPSRFARLLTTQDVASLALRRSG